MMILSKRRRMKTLDGAARDERRTNHAASELGVNL